MDKNKKHIKLLYLSFLAIIFLTTTSNLVAAEWNSTLNEGLKTYYNFNSPTNLVDGTYNLSANEGSMIFSNTTCLIGNCGQASIDNNFKIPANPVITYSGDYSMNFWVRGQSDGGGPKYFWGAQFISGYQFGWDTPGTTYIYHQNGWTGSAGNLAGGPVGYNTWFMMTVTKNSSGGNVKIYRDGILRDSGSGGPAFVQQDILIGNVFNNQFDWLGQFDEFGYWNRTLGPAEIEQLYNNGAGITLKVIPNNIGAVTNPNSFICMTNQVNNFTANQIFSKDVSIYGMLTGGKNIFAAYDGKGTGSYRYPLSQDFGYVQFDTEDRKDSYYTHSTSGDNSNVTLLATGNYNINYNVCAQTISHGAAGNTLLTARLVKNGIEVPGTRTYFWAYSQDKSYSCGTINKELIAAENDKVGVQIAYFGGQLPDVSINNIADASYLRIQWSQ